MTDTLDGRLDAPSAPNRPLPIVPLGVALVAHIPIGLAMHASPTLATAHAALTLAVTIWILFSARSPAPVVAVAAYIAGSEVLWRQTGAAVPWEFAKYLIILVFAAGVLRFVGKPRRAGVVGVFVACLVPAALVPVVQDGIRGALDPLAFNLAGLLALAVGVLLLSHLAGSWEALSPVPWAFVAPVTATAAIAASGVAGLASSDFFNDSNVRASGGYGPNQVSAVLGLAVVFLVLIAVRDPRRTVRIGAVVFATWFLLQALLTFSRGGVLNVAVALLVAIPFLVGRRDTGTRIVLLLALGLVAASLLAPRLESFTGGMIGVRFTDTRQADRRSELVKADVETFTEHPVLGVGVGQAERYRLDRLVISSHTEYTRLLAEHGTFGIAVMTCLVAMAVADLRRQRTAFGYAWSVALIAWTAAELWHASTRIAATPLAFALASFTLVETARLAGRRAGTPAR